MTPAATSVNEAWLWVFCSSGSHILPEQLRIATPRNGARARSTTTESSSLSTMETFLGVVHGRHLTFGTPR